MTAFEIFMYAAAILTVLWLRAEPQAPTPIAVAPAVQPVDDLPALPVLLAQSEKLTAPPVVTSRTVAADMVEPVAIARIEDAWIAELEVEPPSPTAAADYLETWSAQELRRECSRRGIAWRNAHGKGKHLLKEEMLKALC
jgi:hypothetical protein